MEVKSSKPSLVVQQAEVTFVRSPWGNAAGEDRATHAFPPGPYYALAPGDPLDGPASIDASAFTFLDGAAPVLVRVWSDAAMTSLLGIATPDADSKWPRTGLVNLDVPTAFVTGVDDAGNESLPQMLENVEWIATPNPPGYGRSPHALTVTGMVAGSRIQHAGSRREAGPGSEGRDGEAISAPAEMAWRQRIPSAAVGPRIVHNAAYDPGRGVTVLFGGWDGTKLLQDVLEWDGSSWADRTPSGRKPPVRMSAALAYDSWRGRTVLFGGFNGLGVYQDIWEWDGAEWSELQPAGGLPPERSGIAAAFDPVRGRMLVFGGRSGPALLADLWEWDGIVWERPAPAGAAPPARSDAAMAYDFSRGRAVMFGGWSENDEPLGDLWEWDGSSWTQAAAAGPRPMVYHSMVYDAGRARSVLFGGWDGEDFLADVWEWDGAAWTNLQAAGGPGARGAHASAYDAGRGVTLVVGGCAVFGAASDCAETRDDTWGWDGTAWRDLTPGAVWPEARFGHSMAYDSAGRRAVLFGGSKDFMSGLGHDTWMWDGARFVQLAPAETTPPARGGAGTAVDSKRGRQVLFGGCDGFDANLLCASFRDDTWEFDGNVWSEVVPSGARPQARYAHPLVYDSVRERTVLFGGSPEGGFQNDTWEWDGASWLEMVVSGPKPPPRDSHALAFDAQRARTVLFGGWNGVEFLGDLWEWDGGTWHEIQNAGPWPEPRGNPVMVFDPERGRVVLFGGDVSAGTVQVQDTWEWDGSQWHDVTPSGMSPAPRAAHGAAFDREAKTMVVFGGFSENSILNDLWERVEDPARRPAVEFDAGTEGAGFATGQIAAIRVRAFAGGVFSPFDASSTGATLFGWSTGGPGLPPGGWQSLASNVATANDSGPYLPGPDSTLVSWVSKDAAQAKRFVTERDGRLSFQIRPSGPTGNGTRESLVAVDYVEVRVRYKAE